MCTLHCAFGVTVAATECHHDRSGWQLVSMRRRNSARNRGV
jgi:hypothetical protein